MKFTMRLTAFILISCLFSCTIEDIAQYAPRPEETFPSDTALKSMANKRAMIVVAHDDDMCTMAGTISMLNRNGWNICILSFHKGEERDKAHMKACKPILDTVTHFNLDYASWRKDNLQKLYIPKAKFDSVFDKTPVESELVKRFREFNPSIVFTLDHEIGGYGHCEHVFISQLVVDNAKELNVDYIYQAVYPRHMMNSIMARHSKRMKEWGYAGDDWETAKQTYQVDGMPLPTVQINITAEATNKMNYLKSYNERERKTIGFFIPAFEDYSAEEYFKVFDREFFRVIKVDRN